MVVGGGGQEVLEVVAGHHVGKDIGGAALVGRAGFRVEFMFDRGADEVIC